MAFSVPAFHDSQSLVCHCGKQLAADPQKTWMSSVAMYVMYLHSLQDIEKNVFCLSGTEATEVWMVNEVIEVINNFKFE